MLLCFKKCDQYRGEIHTFIFIDSLAILNSGVIEDIHLAPTNRNQVVKTWALYDFIHFNMLLDPAIPDQDAMHLAATRKKKLPLCRRCWSPKTD